MCSKWCCSIPVPLLEGAVIFHGCICLYHWSKSSSVTLVPFLRNIWLHVDPKFEIVEFTQRKLNRQVDFKHCKTVNVKIKSLYLPRTTVKPELSIQDVVLKHMSFWFSFFDQVSSVYLRSTGLLSLLIFINFTVKALLDFMLLSLLLFNMLEH